MLPKCRIEGRPASLGHEATGFGFRRQGKGERSAYQIDVKAANGSSCAMQQGTVWCTMCCAHTRGSVHFPIDSGYMCRRKG